MHFTGDFANSLIQAARLEHWFGVFRGTYHWRDPTFFYPEKNVLGYNDAYFLYGVLYSEDELVYHFGSVRGGAAWMAGSSLAMTRTGAGGRSIIT